MLGTPKILTFSFRALVLLLVLPVLWISVAEQYNEALVALAQRLLPDDISLKALGRHILIGKAGQEGSLSIDGFTLHYGLVLLAVLVLAAVGIGAMARVRWLMAMGAGVFLLHVVGLAALARGVAWTATDGSTETAVFRLFAVFWGLLPAAIGGAWCFLYWLPRASAQSDDAPVSGGTPDRVST